jgi:hypothetical protein
VTLQIAASLSEDSRGVICAPRVFNYAPRVFNYAPRVFNYAPRVFNYAPREHLYYSHHL